MAATREATDAEAIWEDLSSGILDIYAHREVTSLRYMQLYTHVYSYCSRKPNGGDGSRAIQGGNSTGRRSGESGRVRRLSSSFDFRQFIGQDFYTRMRNLFKTHLTDRFKNAADKVGEELVRFYLQEWERFTFSSTVVNGFCSYINRHGSGWQYDQDHLQDIYDIYSLALDAWREIFFEPLHAPTVATILEIINQERNGATINTGDVKGMIGSLVELGNERNRQDSPPNANRNAGLGIYQRLFQDPFLAQAERFYEHETLSFMQSGKPVSDYLQKVEQRLNEEERRANLFLHNSTTDIFIKKVENILIEKQLPFLFDEFPKMLRAEQVEDMARMYNLLSKLEGSLPRMSEILRVYITNEGIAALTQCRELCNNDPRECVKTILEVHRKFSELIDTAFKQDLDFVAALGLACANFINKDFEGDSRNSRHPKTAETLAVYCDLLLKKSVRNYDDHELDDMLNETMTIFKFIEDKDVFQKCYSRMLANRLAGKLSASDDAELSMISKLKIACGFDYTTKLQRMYQDVTLSRGTNEDFRAWIHRKKIEPLKVDFNVMVLTSGSWPITVNTNDPFLLPQVLEPCVNIFTQYYGELHSGRKITWLYSKSKGEIVTNCFTNRYTLTMSTYSMVVLLQYNTKDSYKLHELVEATQLKADVVTQTVQILMHGNILKSTDDDDKLSLNSVIYLFKDYKNKKQKTSLLVPLKIHVKQEVEKEKTSIELGRHHVIKAAIVRIMKARKSLDHQLLLSEIIKLVENRFKPAIPLMQKCIDDLVGRDYLRRKEGEQSTYEYVT